MRGQLLREAGVAIIGLTLVISGELWAQERVPPPGILLGAEDERYLSAKEGVIYYTIDGSDPRGSEGQPSSTAKIARSARTSTVVLISEEAPFRFVVPVNGRSDTTWFSTSFDDAAWTSGSGGIGYDRQDTYVPLIGVDVREAMDTKTTSVYVRWEFQLDDALPEAATVGLQMRCDDGFIAYLNGNRVASQNAPDVGRWNASATATVNDDAAVQFQDFPLSNGRALLRKERNVLAIHALNEKATSSDFLMGARLVAKRLQKGTEVWHPEEPIAVTARVLLDGAWSEALRIPGRDRADRAGLAKDWPQLLGPGRAAIYDGAPIFTNWPDEGPRVVWRETVGQGHSSPVVSEGKVILAHSPRRDFALTCFNARTGELQWTKSFRTTFRAKTGGGDSGPRPTPTIHGGKVYFANGDGLLGCVRMADGEVVWSRQLMEDFETDASWHGFIASPLVTREAVIYPIGSQDAATAAFGPEDGELLWKSGNDKVSGVSPMLTTFGGVRQIITVGRRYLRALEPERGRELWRLPTRRQSSGNLYCAGPVVFGDEFVLSGWYGLGALRLRMTTGKPELVWHRDQFISTHYSSLIIHNGYAYGYHGHATVRPVLRCVHVSSGREQWKRGSDGYGTIVRCQDQLLILKDSGELVMIKADPEAYQELGRAQVTGRTTRTYPAIVDGYAYVRGPRRLVCLDLRPQE